MTEPATSSEKATLRAFAVEAAQLFSDRHCEEVTLLDVRGLSQVCDFVLIGTGTSDRQMKSLASEVEDLGGERGHQAFRKNMDVNTTWIVVDFVDLVAHLFEPTHRRYYDLEGLWSDAPVVDWEKESGRSEAGAVSGD